MRRNPTATATALAALIATFAAQAQPVYRCGSAYSRVPCAEGRAVDADDSRTGAQRAEAARVARDEKRLGDGMARDRRAAEAAQRPQAAASLGPAKAPAPASAASAPLKPTKKAKAKIRVLKPEDFVATTPRKPAPDAPPSRSP